MIYFKDGIPHISNIDSGYIEVKFASLTLYYRGLFLYKKNETPESFLKDYHVNSVNYNELWGSFRAIIYNSSMQEATFFCDNAGNQIYYVHQKTNRISQSFLECISDIDKKPNMYAIAQFLQFKCVYTYETVVDGVFRTNSNCIYTISRNEIKEKSKSLLPFGKLNTYHNLHSIIARACQNNMNKGAVITGGNDSRTILAHLYSLNEKPQLFISGGNDWIDVQIANKIADKLKLPIFVADENYINSDYWLHEAFRASDGVAPMFTLYRLYNKRQLILQNGVELEFGGAGGELYKNGFINQEFPFYFGKPDWNKFYNVKVKIGCLPDIFGKDIRLCLQSMDTDIIKLLQGFEQDNKYNSFLCAGHFIMQQRIITTSNIASLFYTPYAPLLERDSVALTYARKPYSLEMQRFQRAEISQYCNIIAAIPTDRGLTCSANASSILNDFLKNYMFLIKIYVNRQLFRNISPKSHLPEELLNSSYFQNSLQKCNEIGILKSPANVNAISPQLLEALSVVGFIFM